MNKITIFLFGIIIILLSTKAYAKCIVGGCSGQLCVFQASDGISNCMYSEEYGCYKIYGECTEQSDGKCGWTKTEKLLECLKNPSIATKELEKRNSNNTKLPFIP